MRAGSVGLIARLRGLLSSSGAPKASRLESRGATARHCALWNFSHTSFTLSRLLGNMGAHASTPFLSRFDSPAQAGEERWLNGFYLDTPVLEDDPYRFFGWQRVSPNRSSRFEIGVNLQGRHYLCSLALELPEGFKELRVFEESLACDSKEVFSREHAQVSLARDAVNAEARLRVDWHLIALPALERRYSGVFQL
jgi:hypothetical protein